MTISDKELSEGGTEVWDCVRFLLAGINSDNLYSN